MWTLGRWVINENAERKISRKVPKNSLHGGRRKRTISGLMPTKTVRKRRLQREIKSKKDFYYTHV